MPAPGHALDAHSRRLRHVCAMDAEPVTEAQVRAARHAYYGAIAYIDDLLGRLMAGAALGRVGRGHDRHPHQRSRRDAGRTRPLVQDELPRGRVPRAARHRQSRPLRAAPRRRQRLACRSHADARRPRGRECQSLGIGVDGRSLAPHLRGAGGHDEAIGEYLAEGAIAPMVMIRRGAYKFIHSPVDPDQLFDLSATRASATTLRTIRQAPRSSPTFAPRSGNAGTWPNWTRGCALASAGAGLSMRRLTRARSRPGISSRSRKRRVNMSAIPWISMTSRRRPAFRRSRAPEIRQQESGGRATGPLLSRSPSKHLRGCDGGRAARDDGAGMGTSGPSIPVVGRIVLLHWRRRERAAALDPGGA